MPRLAVSLLGAPRIELDGAPIDVDTRKAIALVAYLALTGQRQSRDALAGFLWPDAESGRAALRRTLSVLSKALGGRFLVADRENLGLDEGPELSLDVREFEAASKGCPEHRDAPREDCASCLASLGRAAALYRGEFLEGFSLRDSERFDEWRFFQAERLRRELGQVLQRLVRGRGGRREYGAAIEDARRWLALDPLHEPAHRALMRLYARAGQRSAALRQYRECVRLLDRELGVPPLEETTRLYEAIKEDRRPTRDVLGPEISPRAEGTTASSAGVPAHPDVQVRPTEAASDIPLVGRDAEWTRLLQAYDGARGGGRLLVVEGEAGVGKTRLAEALAEHVRADGAKVVATRCFQGEGDLAFGPFLDALRSVAQRPDAAAWLDRAPAHAVAEAARLLPELADLRPGLPPAPPLDSPGGQSRFFEGICQVLLAATAGPRPGLLVFDDLQWSDAASLDLLAYLVRRTREQSRGVLLVWRTEDVPPGHPLRRILTEAERDGRATAMSLRRLDRAAVARLVSALRRGTSAPPSDFVERLFHETEGLPFFVVTYLAALDGEARAPDVAWALPTGGRDFLRVRLAALSDVAHQLLGAAAVIGRSFDFDTLRLASGRSDEETLAALEELLGRGVVVEAADDPGAATPPHPSLPYDFSHEKLRSLVYEETSLARRRLLHRRVAEALLARSHRGRGGEDLGVIARHFRLAGLDDEAATYYRRAGERARALYANREALAHFRDALALGDPDPAGLHEAIGDLLTLLGEFGAALRSYETAAALAEPTALGGLERKLGTIYHRRGEWDLAESHFAAAEARLDEGAPAGARARLLADWSLTAHRRGRFERARELATRALELARAAGDDHVLAPVHNLLGILAGSGGDLMEARRHLEESLALAERSADPAARAASLNNLALVCAQSGDPARAIQLAETALALCRAQGDRHREAALHNNLADLLHAIGDSQASLDHLRRAVGIYAEIGVEAGALQPEIWKLTEW